MKTQIVALAFSALFFACTNYEEPAGTFPPPEYGAYAMRMLPVNTQAPESHAADEPVAQKPKAPGKLVASGTIDILPGIAAKLPNGPQVIFLLARSPQGGPPLAVKRLVVNQFPLPFELTSRDVMIQGTDLGEVILLTARLDADGQAGPVGKGDVENGKKPSVKPGTKQVRLILDQLY